MKLLFIGSGELACPALSGLLGGVRDRVVGVVTQPARPKGRHLLPGACPVGALAASAGIPVLAPEQIRSPESIAAIRALRPDWIVVAAYGQFLPRAILDLPPAGCVNIHPSLLPKYRGAAPIQWAIANGETVTGVTLLHMTARMDAGDMILRESLTIRSEDTAETLEPRLARLGADLLRRALDLLHAGGRLPRIPQNDSEATWAPRIRKEDGQIRWSDSAARIACRIRGFHPWPGSFCAAPDGSGRRLKIYSVTVTEESGPPGAVIRFDSQGDPIVSAGEGALALREAQMEGGRRMRAADCARGARWKVGCSLAG